MKKIAFSSFILSTIFLLSISFVQAQPKRVPMRIDVGPPARNTLEKDPRSPFLSDEGNGSSGFISMLIGNFFNKKTFKTAPCPPPTSSGNSGGSSVISKEYEECLDGGGIWNGIKGVCYRN